MQWRTVPFLSDGIFSPNFAGDDDDFFPPSSQAAFAARQSGVERRLLDCVYGMGPLQIILETFSLYMYTEVPTWRCRRMFFRFRDLWHDDKPLLRRAFAPLYIYLQLPAKLWVPAVEAKGPSGDPIVDIDLQVYIESLAGDLCGHACSTLC